MTQVRAPKRRRLEGPLADFETKTVAIFLWMLYNEAAAAGSFGKVPLPLLQDVLRLAHQLDARTLLAQLVQHVGTTAASDMLSVAEIGSWLHTADQLQLASLVAQLVLRLAHGLATASGYASSLVDMHQLDLGSLRANTVASLLACGFGAVKDTKALALPKIATMAALHDPKAIFAHTCLLNVSELLASYPQPAFIQAEAVEQHGFRWIVRADLIAEGEGHLRLSLEAQPVDQVAARQGDWRLHANFR